MPAKKYLKNKLAKELLKLSIEKALKKGYPQVIIATAFTTSKQNVSKLAKINK